MKPYHLIRKLLFRLDPERVHNFVLRVGFVFGKIWIIKKILSFFYVYNNEKLNTEVLGIKFKNPVGLAAGFDKNAVLTDVLSSVGFGFMEIGSITGEPCKGNPKPRLFRLIKDKSLLVRYGLPSEGAEKISKKIRSKKFDFPVGVSIAKTNDVRIKGEDAIKDYVKSFKLLHKLGDYTTINLSCPNTPDRYSFSNPSLLNKLLGQIGKCEIVNPVFIKIKPDMSLGEADKMMNVVSKHRFVKGFVISNLSVKRDNLRTDEEEMSKFGTGGGISGKPAENKSNRLIKYFYHKTRGNYFIIGCGGIFSAEDAYKKIKLGASLLQLITGMIYEGPGLIKEINKGLVELMEKDGYNKIEDAIGTGC